MSSRTRAGLLGVLLLLGGISVHGYASTNSIQMEEAGTTAGFGSQTVQKLTINDVDVTTDGSNKNLATAIVFTIPSLQLSSSNDAVAWMQPNGGGQWSSCGSVSNGTTSITCLYTGAVSDIGKTSGGSIAPLQLVTVD